MSLRFRLALFGATVVLLVIFVFGLLVYQLAKVAQTTEQDNTLSSRARDIAQQLAESSSTPVATGQSGVVGATNLRAHEDVFVEVLDVSGTVLSSTGTVDGQAPVISTGLLQEAATRGGTVAAIAPAAFPVRVAVQPWKSSAGKSGFVVVGQPIGIQETNLNGVKGFLIIAAIPTLLAALGASWMVSGRALRPLKAIAATADTIGTTRDFSRRLPESPRLDELGRLSRSFNLMLQELDDAYKQVATSLQTQRRFVADASHELRTPLTTIRGNAGLLASGKAIPAEDQIAAARDIARESERMSRLVEGLLTLARADGGQHLELTAVAIDALVADVCRQAQQTYSDHVIELVPAQPSALETPSSARRINGDEDALRQLLWILLDNAAKHTPAGCHVQVAVVSEGQALRLVVADDGPGVPAADIERVFERFHQADPARTSVGTGLGLSIARWIAEQHGGDVTVRNNDIRGCTFTVHLGLLT